MDSSDKWTNPLLDPSYSPRYRRFVDDELETDPFSDYVRNLVAKAGRYPKCCLCEDNTVCFTVDFVLTYARLVES